VTDLFTHDVAAPIRVTWRVRRPQRCASRRFPLTKGNAMNTSSSDASEEDITMNLLRSIDDGSVESLALFFLLTMQLEHIRALPERHDADRNVPRR
jgi:hypothetical protein